METLQKRLKSSSRNKNSEGAALIRSVIHHWRMANDMWYRIQHYKILPKEKGTAGLVNFRFNAPQRKLQALIKKQIRAGVPIRIILLKARQWGGSTFTEGLIFDRCVMYPHNDALILSYEKDNAEWLCGMSRRMYENYPEELVSMLPKRTRDNILTGMDFANGSKMAIKTAKNIHAGAGSTRNIIHISEVARFTSSEQTLLSLLNAVPKTPNSIVVLESTAQGTSNYFHRKWEQANNPDSRSMYLPLFVGWNEVEEYTMPFLDDTERRVFNLNLSDYEKDLKATFNLTLEQLNWRKFTITDECEGDEALFRQEFPITPEEAFLTSGTPRFDTFVIDGWDKERLRREQLEPVNRRVISPETGYIQDSLYGPLVIYEDPLPNDEYVIGVDPAEGKAVGDDGRERDDSVIQVFRREHTIEQRDGTKKIEKMRQVAVWRSNKLEMSDIGHIAGHIGKLFNNALICVEANSGHNTIYVLVNEIKYKFMVRKTDTGKGGQIPLRDYGFYTSTKSKKFIIDMLAQLIKDESITIRDKVTLKQCQTFVRDAMGHTKAQQGCKDDDVMAMAMAIWADYVHNNFKTRADSIKEEDHFGNIQKYIDKEFGMPKKKKKKRIRPVLDVIDSVMLPDSIEVH